MLIDRGSNVNEKDSKGFVALHASAFKGNIVCCELLLDRGANIHEVNNDLYNSLQWVCREGHNELVLLLLTRDARLTGRTNDGETAVTLAQKATKGNNQYVVDVLKRWPFTMWVAMLQDLFIWHCLDASSFFDMWEYYE